MIAGLWLRLLLGLAAVGTLLVATAPGIGPAAAGPLLLGCIALVGWLLLRPGSAAALVLIVAAVLLRLILDDGGFDGGLLGLIVLLPLVHQAAALAAQLPMTSMLHRSALRPTAVRYAGVVGSVVLAVLVVKLVS